jgi:tetratricopeptide (TPR) repeat protein
MPAQSITEAVVEDSLRPRGLDEPMLARLHTLFARCDQARYAQTSTHSDLAETAAELAEAIKALREFTPQKAVPTRVARGMLPLAAALFLAAQAQAANEFEEGNTAYAEGKLNSAINHYETLVKQKQVSPALYFNLGNAYFKMGHVGQAIAYYRLAQELAPRDSDIANNLQMARTRANGSAPFHHPWWRSWTRACSLDEWTLAAMVAGWGLAALIIVRLWLAKAKPGLARGMRWAGALFAIMAVGMGLRLGEYLGPAPAVVIAKDVPARYGPLDDSRSAFVMPDGTEVLVIDRQGEWLQIRDSQARTGWLKQGLVQVLK